ncbi:MAG: 30S ribosomal protein S6 [Alphaproteobacteria bacterium]|nr:30S ribosomal protein S6 [Alphaproteobacteria bacterium]
MACYETVVLARREISPAQFETLLSGLETYLKDNTAKISRKENWGLRPLAYKIRKSSKAYYGLLNYDASKELVHEFQCRMSLMEDVVRELTVTTKNLPTEPSEVVRGRDDR